MPAGAGVWRVVGGARGYRGGRGKEVQAGYGAWTVFGAGGLARCAAGCSCRDGPPYA